ncbi:MAG: isochorismatase hydrolase [Bacillota bacterium]|nr:isochorismatase hydrolase [Bacillota bacterium]
MSKALLVIDLQNDYFPGGKFPLWNTEKTLKNVLTAIERANHKRIPVIHIQHIADPERGMAPFFNEGTDGASIKPEVLEAAPGSPIVIKHHADGFYQTNLSKVLDGLGVKELILCGMMTQNCVTHTAISKSAEPYSVTMIPECCTTVNEAIHAFAVNAVSTRLKLGRIEEAI